MARAALQTLYDRLYTDDLHPVRVATMCTTDEEQEVALFHDAVEDGLCTYEDVMQAGLTTEQCLALELLDKAGRDYESYIDSIVHSLEQGHTYAKIAATVKVYDLYDHLDPVRIKNISFLKAKTYCVALADLLVALQDTK